MSERNSLTSSFLYFLILVFTLFFDQAYAQKSKVDLEKSKRKQENKIKKINAILKETKSEKAASIGYLNALQEKIKAQKKIVNYVNQELLGINNEITENQKIVFSLTEDLENLKREYSVLLYNAQKNHKVNELYYLFSSDSFRQAMMRLSYLKQYSKGRMKQAEAIESIKHELERQVAKYESSRKEKQKVLGIKLKESKNLRTLEVKQSGLIVQLNKRQKELNKELIIYKKSLKELNQLIAKTVAENLKKSKKKGTDGSLGKNFASRQNHKLSWPVKNSFISRPFGKIPHPVLKGITIQNQGVDIQTPKGAAVKSVYGGLIKRIAFIPGAMNNVVIVQHGDYFTVYAKLKDVKVKVGDVVKLGEVIGSVDTDNEGKNEVQFQIWKGSKNLNPKKWLKK